MQVYCHYLFTYIFVHLWFLWKNILERSLEDFESGLDKTKDWLELELKTSDNGPTLTL